MPHKYSRKLINIGETSVGIIIPKAWLDYYGLNDEDHVVLISNDEITIRREKNKDESGS